jgi:hypothetical protein
MARRISCCKARPVPQARGIARRVRFVGHLRSWRRIDVAQIVEGEPVGGVTIEVQVSGPGVAPLPPTTTLVTGPG